VDVSPSRCGEVARHIRHCHKARAGHFIDFSVVALFGERRHYDIGNVVNVDKGFGRLSGWKRDRSVYDHVDECAFGEVLIEPAGTNNRPIKTAVLDNPFARLGFFFAAAREDHQTLHASLSGLCYQAPDRVRRPRHGKVRRVSDVDAGDAIKRGSPALFCAPVERRDRGSRSDPNRSSLGLESLGDAAARFTGSSNDEGKVVGKYRGTHELAPKRLLQAVAKTGGRGSLARRRQALCRWRQPPRLAPILYDRGVSPDHRLNARVKPLCSENPARNAISARLKSLSRSNR